MSDDRTNQFRYRTKIFKPEFRYTPAGKAVFNAGFSFASKPNGDENADWASIWWELTAWEDTAEQMNSDLEHGDELVVTGRVSSRSFIDRAGEVRSKQTLTVDTFEKVGSGTAKQPGGYASPPTEDNDVPF